MKCTRHRCRAAPWNHLSAAAASPRCALEITRRTPVRPRSRNEPKNCWVEPLALAVADVASQHSTVAVRGDPGGHHRRHRRGLGHAVAHIEVGGVQVDVGELDVVQAPAF